MPLGQYDIDIAYSFKSNAETFHVKKYMNFFFVGSNIRATIRPSEHAPLSVWVTYHILGTVQESSAFHYIALFPFN